MKKISYFLCVFLFLLCSNFVRGEDLPRVPHLRVLNPLLDSIAEYMLDSEFCNSRFYTDRKYIDREDWFLVLVVDEDSLAAYKIKGMVLGGDDILRNDDKRIDYNDLYKRNVKYYKKKLFGYFLYDGYVVLVYSTTVLKHLFVREDTIRTFGFMKLYPPPPPLKPGVVPPPSLWEPVVYYFTLNPEGFTFDDAMR